jgi:hypothetical protein
MAAWTCQYSAMFAKSRRSRARIRAFVRAANYANGQKVIQFVTLFVDAQGSRIAPHEFGHVLGLIDRYDETTQRALPGFENNLMGDSNKSTNRLSEADIDEVIQLNRTRRVLNGMTIEKEY